MNHITVLPVRQDHIAIPVANVKLSEGDGIEFFSRKSSIQQHHEADVVELKKAGATLGLPEPIHVWEYTNCGILGKIEAEPHFEELATMIQSKLQKIPSGNKFYAVACSEDRIARPASYTQKNQKVVYTEEDYDRFNKWVLKSFKERAGDVIFAVLQGGTPGEIRGYQTQRGKTHKNSKKNQSNDRKPHIKKYRSRILKSEALKLRANGMNAGEIFRYFEKEYPGSFPSLSLIQKWLRKAGCQETRRGRRWVRA